MILIRTLTTTVCRMNNAADVGRECRWITLRLSMSYCAVYSISIRLDSKREMHGRSLRPVRHRLVSSPPITAINVPQGKYGVPRSNEGSTAVVKTPLVSTTPTSLPLPPCPQVTPVVPQIYNDSRGQLFSLAHSSTRSSPHC